MWMVRILQEKVPSVYKILAKTSGVKITIRWNVRHGAVI
jgi:hypothetical protein